MQAIGAILIAIGGIFIPAIISITKAKMSGRKGPGLLQPLRDILRLFRKGSVYSTTTSMVFQLAPAVYLASIVTAILFVPFSGQPGLISFEGDFVFFAYILALGRFLMIIGAMDTGSGFGGMGASREALYAMLVEPVFFVLIGSLALLTEHTSLSSLYEELHFGHSLSYLIAALGVYLLVQIMMVENSRLPVDDPKTHLELTMVHEAMVLDHSGFDLALVNLGSGLKFAMFGGLIANFLGSPAYGVLGGIGSFLGTFVLLGVAVGILESFRARNKMARNAQWILALSALAVLAFFSALVITHKLNLN